MPLFGPEPAADAAQARARRRRRMTPFRLDRSSSIPLAQQIAGQLQDGLAQGTWQVGELLPPELELAAQLGVARATVRQAIQHLVLKGYLRRRRGQGTFVV